MYWECEYWNTPKTVDCIVCHLVLVQEQVYQSFTRNCFYVIKLLDCNVLQVGPSIEDGGKGGGCSSETFPLQPNGDADMSPACL